MKLLTPAGRTVQEEYYPLSSQGEHFKRFIAHSDAADSLKKRANIAPKPERYKAAAASHTKAAEAHMDVVKKWDAGKSVAAQHASDTAHETQSLMTESLGEFVPEAKAPEWL